MEAVIKWTVHFEASSWIWRSLFVTMYVYTSSIYFVMMIGFYSLCEDIRLMF